MKNKGFALAIIIIAILLSLMPKEVYGQTLTTLNVMSFNFAWNNQTKTNDRLLANRIKNQELDIIGIPECGKTPDSKIRTAEYLQSQLNGLGYPVYMKNYKDKVGQCILSKYSIQNYEKIEFSKCGDCAFAPVIQIFSIDHPVAGQIWFIVNHPDASNVKPPNDRVVELLQTRFANLPTFILGDFNVKPINPNIQMILQTHNSACPITIPYSDHSLPCNNTLNVITHPSLLPGTVIDYVFYPKAGWRLLSGYVGVNLLISDHFPVIGKFAFEPTIL